MKNILTIIFLFILNSSNAQSISPDSAKYYEGKWITVCGEVKGIYHNETGKGSPTNLNFGAEYPNQTFVALIWGDDLTKFNFDMKTLKGKKVCVNGLITMYKGKPEIEIKSESQLVVK